MENIKVVTQANLTKFAAEAKAKFAAKTALNTLIGEDTSKSARAIAAEEVAKVVAGADASFDTLKEIADWILSDSTGAAGMASDISALKAKTVLGTYTPEGGEPTEYATVKAYVEAYVAQALTGYVQASEIQTCTDAEIEAMFSDD